MTKRRSIYLSESNHSALKQRFNDDPDTQSNGQLNYTKAVNAALNEWQQGQGDNSTAQAEPIKKDSDK